MRALTSGWQSTQQLCGMTVSTLFGGGKRAGKQQRAQDKLQSQAAAVSVSVSLPQPQNRRGQERVEGGQELRGPRLSPAEQSQPSSAATACGRPQTGAAHCWDGADVKSEEVANQSAAGTRPAPAPSAAGTPPTRPPMAAEEQDAEQSEDTT
eukprot:SAG22_NODE_6635_length_828_cov_1.525377_1_plen_151_part_01